MQDLVRSRKMKRQKWEVTSEQPYLNLKTSKPNRHFSEIDDVML